MQWCVKPRARRNDASINHDPEPHFSVADDAPGGKKTTQYLGENSETQTNRNQIVFVLGSVTLSFRACARAVIMSLPQIKNVPLPRRAHCGIYATDKQTRVYRLLQ